MQEELIRQGRELAFWSGESRSFGTATDAIPLPEPEPRTVGLFLIVPSIGGHKIAGGQRSLVRNREDPFQPFDFGDGPFGVHIPNIYQNSPKVK